MPASGTFGELQLQPIGWVESPLIDPGCAPCQGEGAPDAWLHINDDLASGLGDLRPGAECLILTWLDRARRDVLEVHPQGNPANPILGVFSTRSPHRPNPIGVHPVRIRAVVGTRIEVGPLEAVDGTPVLDIKPLLERDRTTGTRASFERMQWQPRRDGGQGCRRTNDPDKGGKVSTQGIGLLYLETHNWEQSARSGRSLGFKLEFETDHHSGVLVAENGTRIFLAEQSLDDPLGADIYLAVADAAESLPTASTELVREFTPTHWGTQVMTVRDPDGRLLRLEAPLASESE